MPPKKTPHSKKPKQIEPEFSFSVQDVKKTIVTIQVEFDGLQFFDDHYRSADEREAIESALSELNQYGSASVTDCKIILNAGATLEKGQNRIVEG